VQGGLVAAARRRVTRTERQMDRARDLLIEERIAREAGHAGISTNH